MKLVAVLAFTLLVPAGAMQGAPLTQCPATTVSGVTYTGCNFLITANSDGSFTSVLDPSQPFISGEDNYAGFQNNTSHPIASILIDGSGITIFALDRDGPSSAPSSRGFCPGVGSGLTGYEGPGVTFSNVSTDCTSGLVNFNPAILGGGSAYFFLEEAVSPESLPKGMPDPSGPAVVPECSSVVLTAGGLILLLCQRSRRFCKPFFQK